MNAFKRSFRLFARRAMQLHRDQRGDMLEILLMMGAFIIPVSFVVLPMLWEILQDYYLSFAYCIGWPFL